MTQSHMPSPDKQPEMYSASTMYYGPDVSAIHNTKKKCILYMSVIKKREIMKESR